MSGLEIAAGIAGLISFTSRIIEMLTGLTSAIPKSTRLLTSLLNLRHVLERVFSEFSRTIGVLQQSELNITSGLLRKCLEDIEHTCQEYDVLLQKIRKRRGGFRHMKWKTSESDRREMDTRLEAGKSTLQLLLSSITEARQRQARGRGSPPPYTETDPGEAVGIGAGIGAIVGVYGGLGLICALASGPVGWGALATVVAVGASGTLAGTAIGAAVSKS